MLRDEIFEIDDFFFGDLALQRQECSSVQDRHGIENAYMVNSKVLCFLSDICRTLL